MIAAISQMINNAVNRTSNADVGYELISAKIELHANQEVIKAFHAWHDAYHEWVDNYLAGQPQKIGETGLAILSSNQSGYSDKAKELYPMTLADLRSHQLIPIWELYKPTHFAKCHWSNSI